MVNPWLGDAFAHHVWATIRLRDVCRALTAEQIETPIAGTYGSILGTMRHLVNGDSFYLSVMPGEDTAEVDTHQMDLDALRSALAVQGTAWSRLLAQNPDPDAVLVERDEYQRAAPLSIRLAQALHHGSDHRSQICTALTTLGVEPPDIDVWEYGVQNGRVVEVIPNS